MQKDINRVISLFENQFKNKKTFISLHQASISKELSADDINLIFDNPEIFFPASKSRIFLVTWICKEVRKIYEKFEFSDINIPDESYETIRKVFDTKAFNKAEFIKLFNCTKRSHLPYEEFIELEQRYIDAYNNVVEDSLKLSSITHISIKKEIPKPDLSKELQEIIRNEKTKKILTLRSQHHTLEEVGIEMKVTRERVRQIEMRPKTAIVRWMMANVSQILDELFTNNIFDEKKSNKLFGEIETEIIKYSVQTANVEETDFIYLEPLKKVIYDKKGKFIETANNAIEIFKEFDGPVKTNFTDKMYAEGYTFLTDELAEEYLRNSHFSVFNGDAHYGKLTIAKAIEIAICDYPGQKVRITDKKDLENFANFLNEQYQLNVKPDRALSTRIQDILIMVDKAAYGPLCNVSFPEDIILKICEYIKNMPDERISYTALYKIFKDELNGKSSINNHYALHGALRYYEDKYDYLCLRYYLCKSEIQDTLSKAYFEKLPLLLKEHGPLTIEQITQYVPEWNDMYVKYATLYYPEVVLWEDNQLMNVTTIGITKEDINHLGSILNECINNKYKYTNSYLLYQTTSKKASNILDKYDINSEKKLYYVMQYYYSNIYKFRKPHIINKEKVKDSFTTDDLIKIILGKQRVVDKKELLHDLETFYGGKNSSVSLALQRALKSYVRINKNEYISKTRIKMTEEDKKKINELLEKNSIDGTIVIPESFKDFKNLPNLGFKWNVWSLCEIVDHFDFDYKKIRAMNNNSAHAIAPIVSKNSGLKTREDVIKWIVKNKYTGPMNKTDMLRYLREINAFNVNVCTEKFVNELLGK